MPYWIDKSSSVDNLIEVTSDAIVIGSCRPKQLEEIEAKLAGGSRVLELLGTDKVEVLPFSQLVYLRCLSGGSDLDIEMTAGALKTTQRRISFENAKIANQAADAIAAKLPEGFQQTNKQTNEVSASLVAWASFSVAWMLSYTYFDKAPWFVGIVGGMWMFLSGVMIVIRISNPPLIRSWNAHGHTLARWIRSARNSRAWVVLLLILFVGISVIPRFLKTDPLHNYVAEDHSELNEIKQMLLDGVDINAANDAGQTALDWALEFDNHGAATALINLGADFRQADAGGATSVDLAFGDPDDGEIALLMLGRGLDANYVSSHGEGLLATALLNYQEPELISALLKRGADPRQLVDGEPAFQYAVSYEYSEAYLNPLLDAIAGN